MHPVSCWRGTVGTRAGSPGHLQATGCLKTTRGSLGLGSPWGRWMGISAMRCGTSEASVARSVLGATQADALISSRFRVAATCRRLCRFSTRSGVISTTNKFIVRCPSFNLVLCPRFDSASDIYTTSKWLLYRRSRNALCELWPCLS